MKFFSEEQLNKFEDMEAKGCSKCRLNRNCKTPKMPVKGYGKMQTLIVGDYLGEQDDQTGHSFMGEANMDFLNLLIGKGYEPFEDFWFINAINCRKSSKDGGTLVPSDSEIKCCRPYIERIIGELQPTNIILLGEYAVKSFFPFIEKASVDMFRGLSIPDQKTKAWIHTTISPRTIKSQSFNKNLASVYNRDLNTILKRLKNKFKEYGEPEINRLYDAPKIIEELEYLIEAQMPCYIDYETTGLKPYFNGHKIVSMSIASMIEYDKKDLPLTISFPFQYRNYFTPEEQNHIRYCIKKILASGIALSAHNIKFEDSWSRNIIKMRPKNWKFDTQIAAHILDNRKNFTGLKNQVYYNFGIRPYNEHIQPLLEQVEGSEFNRVDEIPLKDLLQYGGLDSAYGLMLEHIQREQIENRDLWGPYNFLHRGTLLMSNMQEKGINMDEEYYHAQKEIIGIRIDELNNKLMTSKEAKLFKRKEGREIDPASGKDLGLLFYEHMSEKKTYTKKGNLSVDKITLDKINNPFVKDLLYLRKLEKTRGTYFAQFLREIYNGRMNPFFNLNIPVSYRSSCIAGYEKVLVMRDFETHPEGIPIKDIKSGDMIYCFDANLNPIIKKVVWQGKTGHREIIRVHYYCGGGLWNHIDCTPDHPIRLITGKYIEAQKLNKGDRILAGARRGDKLNFTGHLKNNKGIQEHRFIYSQLIGELSDDDVVHHKNENHYDHTPSNLLKHTKSSHAKHHIKTTLCSGKSRENNIKAVKQGWKDGKYDHTIKYGKNALNYLNLSKIDCLRMLVKCAGMPKIVKDFFGVDFNTFKKYLIMHNIDWKIVKLRYDKNGVYISKGRLKKLTQLGRSKVLKILGHNHYKLLNLYNFYGFDTKRLWGNQFGDFQPGNHRVTRIEWLGIKEDVYDIQVEDCHNFFVNEICVHNSSGPNFQNIPTREEEIKKLIRSGVKASPGRQLLFWDGQGMEVCTSACYHEDPNMIKYITDPTTDMHRDCFSFDTKILTENGFKFYDEIQDGDKIAQYNPNTDKIEYVIPLDRICHEYKGDMYYIRNRYIDVCITPNHRLYLKRYKKEHKIIIAKDVKKASYYIKTGSDVTDIIKSPKFYFPPVYGEDTNTNKKYQDEFCIKQDDMFELLGYLITDGHFKYHKQKAYRINLSQIKKYSRKIMKSCIDRIKLYTNFIFHEELDKWSVSNKVFCNWLCENFGINKINRKLPKFITHAPIKQLKIFFNACMLGDGHLGKSGNSGTFYTISTQLIEDFQFICMRLGYSSRIDKPILKGNRTVQLYAIRMRFTPERQVRTVAPYFGIEKYEGKVFCFTVPSGILVTQRNNKISIQGNCAADIWMLPHNEITKDIRFYAKNLLVFATFYGSYWQDTGTHLWETCIDSLELKTVSGYPLRQHMADKGITIKNQFLEHCKEVERIFWKERFKVYDKWRWDINEEYKRNGYITSKMGFVFSGIMNRKQVSNYPIQSTAFHLLMWSLLEIEKISIKERWKSDLIAQIHDEGIMDAVPEEVPHIITTAKHVTEVLMPKEFPWINVPFGLDISASPIDGSWYQKKEI